MSDIYFIDTERALSKFADKFNDARHLLSGDFVESFDDLESEIEGLLEQYSGKIEKIEELEEKLEELE